MTEKGLYSESKQDPEVDGTFALRVSSESVTETPLVAMAERVLRGGVCIVGGLPAVDGEVGVVGKSKPLLPQGLPRPFNQTQSQTAAIADSISQKTVHVFPQSWPVSVWLDKGRLSLLM